MEKENAATTYKLKDFMRLINSVNPKKFVFIFGLFLSILTSGASLLVPQLTKGLIDSNLLTILVLAFVSQLALFAC